MYFHRKLIVLTLIGLLGSPVLSVGRGDETPPKLEDVLGRARQAQGYAPPGEGAAGALEAFIPQLRQAYAAAVHRLGVLIGERPSTLYAELAPQDLPVFELLGVVWGIRSFALWLVGQKFTVLCDHQSMRTVFEVELMNEMVAAMLMYVVEFDFIITWIQGKLNSVPDALTRLYTERQLKQLYVERFEAQTVEPVVVRGDAAADSPVSRAFVVSALTAPTEITPASPGRRRSSHSIQIAPLRLSGTLSSEDSGLQLDALQGTAAGVDVSGALATSDAGLAGALDVATLDLGAIAALLLGTDPLAEGEDGRRFANTVFPVPVADVLPPLTVELATPALRFGATDLGAATLGVSLDADMLTVSDLGARLGEGTLTGDLALAREGARVDLSGSLSLDAAAIARIYVESWRSAYPGMLPDRVLIGLSVARQQASWRHAVAAQRGSEAVLVVPKGISALQRPAQLTSVVEA